MNIPKNIELTLAAFRRKHINSYYVENSHEANKLIKSFFKPQITIASGNSLTLRQIGIFDYLASASENSFAFLNQFEQGISPEENLRRRKQGLLADLYLSSANAISEDGKICCLDGKGNRTAALMFGPDKVIIVVGKNKIRKNEEDAWKRIRTIAAPQTSIALKRQLPCALDGTCHDCNSPMRICRNYITINGQMERDKDRMHLIIVNEDLGI